MLAIWSNIIVVVFHLNVPSSFSVYKNKIDSLRLLHPTHIVNNFSFQTETILIIVFILCKYHCCCCSIVQPIIMCFDHSPFSPYRFVHHQIASIFLFILICFCVFCLSFGSILSHHTYSYIKLYLFLGRFERCEDFLSVVASQFGVCHRNVNNYIDLISNHLHRKPANKHAIFLHSNSLCTEINVRIGISIRRMQQFNFIW